MAIQGKANIHPYNAMVSESETVNVKTNPQSTSAET